MSFFSLLLSLCFVLVVFIQVTFGVQVTYTFGASDAQSSITKVDQDTGLTLTVGITSSTSSSPQSSGEGLRLQDFNNDMWTLSFSFDKPVTVTSFTLSEIKQSAGIYLFIQYIL